MNEQTNELKKKFHTENVLQIIKKIVKNSLLEKDYKQVGRLSKFYKTNENIKIDYYNLILWQGYSCNVKLVNDGLFLNVDTANKFIQ